jgi:hypothetical protein
MTKYRRNMLFIVAYRVLYLTLSGVKGPSGLSAWVGKPFTESPEV